MKQTEEKVKGGRKRAHLVKVYLNDDEYEKLCRDAATFKRDKSKYLRLLIEWIEHRAADRLEHALAGRRGGPVIGAVLGLLPQCGFSVAAARLFTGGLISAGTLAAVFIATSDEAIVLMLAHPERWRDLMLLIVVKLVLALFGGFLLDALLRRPKKKHDHDFDTIHATHSHTDLADYPGGACHHSEDCDGGVKAIVLEALRHTLPTFLYMLATLFVFELLIELLGEEAIASVLSAGGIWQSFAAALFGLVPSCASSVLLTQLYLCGGISFGTALAGLIPGAGAGILVLLRGKKADSFRILAFVTLLGAVTGLLFNLIV